MFSNVVTWAKRATNLIFSSIVPIRRNGLLYFLLSTQFFVFVHDHVGRKVVVEEQQLWNSDSPFHATSIKECQGGNKGIGLEICRQLASNEVMVILTARDEKRGTETVENLKACGLSDLFFHQLDVTDSASIASLADYIKNRFGKLDILNVTNEWAREVLSDVDGLTEEKVDEVVSQYLQDAKEDLLESKGWSALSAYVVSKATLNAYMRVLAKQFPNFGINSVTPGFCKTDLSFNNGQYTAEEGAKGPVSWL
ncbi:(+)-neomenthol dehydrogenase [Camellia lanceoleosa]|uniref:(+)-neomenthol dehydrogenase n=1 Tax=Camellia lanceoleosa TaxID=1840588 RepID=A0ACC0FPX3_9ERIC|nr:(+)-neomenthol dehydrogenase [Camellia lanceoleosa]